MLKEFIHEKIDEVFLKYQTEHNVISGDIEPLDAVKLELIEDELVELIEKVVAYQPKGVSAYYTYMTDAGTHYVKDFPSTSADAFFREVSNIIAFGDCSGDTVVHIFFDGKPIEYVGWQKNMFFEYQDLDGETVWSGNFPEWDH